VPKYTAEDFSLIAAEHHCADDSIVTIAIKKLQANPDISATELLHLLKRDEGFYWLYDYGVTGALAAAKQAIECANALNLKDN
jgi:hypothetical protein